jgi:hypothetical protein
MAECGHPDSRIRPNLRSALPPIPDIELVLSPMTADDPDIELVLSPMTADDPKQPIVFGSNLFLKAVVRTTRRLMEFLAVLPTVVKMSCSCRATFVQ